MEGGKKGKSRGEKERGGLKSQKKNSNTLVFIGDPERLFPIKDFVGKEEKNLTGEMRKKRAHKTSGEGKTRPFIL